MDKRVLIVDDDPFALRLLEKYLRDSGYEVMQATNGKEALEIVLAEAPPLLITDWSMPEMDGVTLCRALRQHEGVRFIYIVLVTAHSDIDRLVEAFEAGADDFLPKPVNKQELLARLRAGERIAMLEADLARRTREVHRLNAESSMANRKLAEANAQLQRMATTDELTGLLNRREAMSRIRELWALQARYGSPFSCIMLDIDHFKKFNDSYGHAAGDLVLRETAGVLKKSVRSTDLVCRVGGEEFLVLCPNVGLEGAAVCAEHLRAAVAGHAFVHEGRMLGVTISLGVSARDEAISSDGELLKRADEGLYASKAAGRNRVTVAGAALAGAGVPGRAG
jgi:diguanylate cyclase (GGDEF)-like protein